MKVKISCPSTVFGWLAVGVTSPDPPGTGIALPCQAMVNSACVGMASDNCVTVGLSQRTTSRMRYGVATSRGTTGTSTGGNVPGIRPRRSVVAAWLAGLGGAAGSATTVPPTA